MLRDKLLNVEFRKRLPEEFGGKRIRVTPRADRRILNPGWTRSAHDLMLVARGLVEPGATVWDLGANLGIFSFMAAAKAGPSGKVYAVEADPKYADLVFRSSAMLGDQYAPVSVLCGAIAGSSGLRSFGISSRGHARNRLLSDGDNDAEDVAAVKVVPAFTSDMLLTEWPAPQIVKVDLEGAEIEMIEGSERLLTEVRPTLYIEISEKNSEAAAALLHANDYDIFRLEGDGSETPIRVGSFYTIARPRRS